MRWSAPWWRRPPAPAGWDTPVSRLELLAVDVETTGLDPRRDHLLALGWVPVSRGRVVLGGAGEVLVRPPESVGVGPSATVHGLTDDRLAHAAPLAAALAGLRQALRGRVMVAHHAPIELGFLSRAVRTEHGHRLAVTAVDTLELQRRLLAAGGRHEVPPGALRLDAARGAFGLPRYAAHSAVTDALATAELLLAQVAELEHRTGREATLADLRPVTRR